jgi:adenylate cyclase
VVEITESDLQKVGLWPMPDALLARLLTLLKQQQPRAIGLDLYRDLPVEPGYKELVKIFQTTPNLIGIQKVVGETTGASVNPPPALKERGQIGSNDLLSDADGILRRTLLSLKDRQNHVILTLGTQLALLYLKDEQVTLETLDSKTGQVKLGKTVFTPLSRNEGSYVGLDAGGYQILANFRSLRQGFRSVSLTDVLEKRMPPDFARDRIVLIGVTAESAGDGYLTPYSGGFVGGGFGGEAIGSTSGVFIHADVASQLLSAALDGRAPIHVWPDPMEYLWILGWATVASILCWSGRYRQLSRQTSSKIHDRLPLTAIAIATLLVGLTGGSYLAFLQGWWIPMVPATLTVLGCALGITGYAARSASEMRQTFGRYLTDEVVANLLETPEGLKLGGERRTVTVLISDLRGFSAISEQLSPEKAVSVVNLYLESMTTVIHQYQGTINEILGDGIFVMFGAPIQRDNDAERAVACAIAMQLAMYQVNHQLASKQLPLLEMGIGIHTGEVLAGNVGSSQRAKYTVIGSTVNLASRIESYTVGGQILVSDRTFKAAGDQVQTLGQLQMQAKGIRDPIALYDVRGIGAPYHLSLPPEETRLTHLKQVIPVQYRIVEGKSLIDEAYQGSFVQLSTQAAELQSQQALELLTNLVINLLIETDTSTELWDIYAKVVEVFPHESTRSRIRFTSVPPAVTALFQEWTLQPSEPSTQQTST